MLTNQNKNRRRFLKASCGALVGLAAINIKVYAGDKVPEDDPTAMALGYKEDASQVDTGKYPKRAGEDGAKQFCDNCALYAGDGEWAPCSIFQNRLVAGKGWCNAWVPKG